MEITNSELAASSRDDGASFAPAATSSSARDAVRFQTVNGNPAFNKFIPMGLPISPRPISPTFVCGPTGFTKPPLYRKVSPAILFTQRINCSVLVFFEDRRMHCGDREGKS